MIQTVHQKHQSQREMFHSVVGGFHSAQVYLMTNLKEVCVYVRMPTGTKHKFNSLIVRLIHYLHGHCFVVWFNLIAK